MELTRLLALDLGAVLASIHDLYLARRRKEKMRKTLDFPVRLPKMEEIRLTGPKGTKMTKQIRFAAAVALAAIIFFVATPAFAAGGVQFLGANFIIGKGLVLYFDTNGQDHEEAQNYVVVDGVTYALDCQQKPSGLLACVAAVKQSEIGSQASIYFGDDIFETTVPDLVFQSSSNQGNAGAIQCTGYEYPVIDFVFDIVFLTGDWSIGTQSPYAQDCPAMVGDVIQSWHDVSGYADYGTADFTFSLDGDEWCADDFGNGYYYPSNQC